MTNHILTIGDPMNRYHLYNYQFFVHMIGTGVGRAALLIMMLSLPGCNCPASGSPMTLDCTDQEGWSTEAASIESRTLTLINNMRTSGYRCHSRTFGYNSRTFGYSSRRLDSAPRLVMDESLRCAARRHAYDMAMYDFFAHIDMHGDGPRERIVNAGYDVDSFAENIAKGSRDPGTVVDAWMNSQGHCRNIMDARYGDIGIGFYTDPDTQMSLWTLDFAASCDQP